MIGLAPAATIVRPAIARGLQPDPNMTVDEWSDLHMVIPKESGANEAGKYRTDRTPHAREVMRALSDNHPCKIVALMGASQMLKTQVGLNWFCSTVHQSPANFLWILPTGKLAKRGA
jgi:phage terminase large subunit GpA-like protein